MQRSLEKFDLNLALACPCAGLNVPHRAVSLLHQGCHSHLVFETQVELRKPLSKLHDAEDLHVGEVTGDVMCCSEEVLLKKPINALISGPPCPPISSIGRRQCELDARANVFYTVISWILKLAKDAAFHWFVLENPTGIEKKKAGSSESFAKVIMKLLVQGIPSHWELDLRRLDARDSGTPMSRPRTWIIGTSGSMRYSSFQRRVLNAPYLKVPSVRLVDVLKPHAAPKDWAELSVPLQMNVLHYLALYHAKLESCEVESQIAIVDADRNPLKSFSDISFDVMLCLRTRASTLWILPSKELQSLYGEQGRLVKLEELSILAGICPRSLEGLTQAEARKALGNCIALQSMVIVAHPLLFAWANLLSMKQSGLMHMF